MKLLVVILLVQLSAFSAVAMAECLDNAKTEMEKVYCRVQAKNGARELPPLGEFRKNPGSTQRLLLARPAKKLGISLPPEAKKTAVSAVASQSKPKAKTPTPTPVTNTELMDCQLTGQEIVCRSQRFVLQKNRANNRLAPNALERTSLEIPSLSTSGGADATIKLLQQGYEAYIRAMLEIGLAEVTLSYTKYRHLYDEVTRQDGDFAKRMETMFEFLKNDKKTMGSASGHSKPYPDGLQFCQTLNAFIILCDNVAENWIYQRVSLAK